MPHLHGQGSSIRHGVPCIDRQVEHDLAELTGVRVDPPRLGGEIRADGYVLAQCPAEQLQRLLDDIDDVDDFRRQHLFSCRRQ